MGRITKTAVAFVLLTLINAGCTINKEISPMLPKDPELEQSQQLGNMVINAISSLIEEAIQRENGSSTAQIMKTFPNIKFMLKMAQNWLTKTSDISTLSSIVTNIIFPTNLSSTCRRHLLNPEGYKHISGNSWQMLDAFGKPPSGITRANMHWLGSYGQCLKVKFNTEHPNNNVVDDNDERQDEPVTGVGEYCLAKMYFSRSEAQKANREDPATSDLMDFSSLKWGTCFPSTCSLDDKRAILNHYLNWVGIEVVINRWSCQTAEWKQMDYLAIMITIIMLIPIVLVLVATACDYWLNKRSNSQDAGKFQRFRHIFSARTTMASLYPVPNANKPEFLMSLYAIRLYFTMEVVITHCFSILLVSLPWNNQLDIPEFRRHPITFVWNHGFHIMNVFFYISGFCLSYFSHSGSTFNMVKVMLKRYARISAPFVYVMLFVMGPMAYISKGPKWPELTMSADRCRNNWWKELLYWRNVTEFKETLHCILGEWSLRADMQLYFASLPLVWLLLRRPKIGRISVTLVAILSIVVMGTMTAIKELEVFNRFALDFKAYDINRDNNADLNDRAMFKLQSLYRVPSSSFGLLVGNWLAKNKTKVKLTRFASVCGWTVYALWLTTYFATSTVYGVDQVMPRSLQIIYATVGTFLGCAGITWIIIHCALTPRGWLNSFFSTRLIVVLGRLTYCIFLVHGIVIACYHYSFYESRTISFSQYNCDFAVVFAFTVCGAAILHFAIESPTDRIIKMFYEKPQSKISAK